MFTIDQIQNAHARVKTGADFPKYIQEIIKLGVTHYSSYVSDGHAVYFGKEGCSAQWPSKYNELEVTPHSDPAALQRALKIHQAGQTDFITFCRQAGETGVEKWIVDTLKMTCTYYDSSGNAMITEVIPQPVH
jgi:uncharacterized protein YbcV (DUF1398 family)